MPVVSIILPTYNREHTLSDAMESLLHQTYTDFEVIVIDDGSTDHSRELLEGFCRRDKRIKYFYQDNKGRSAARNYGVKLAAGKYITFLDSDDAYLPSKVQKQVAALDCRPDIDFVYCLHTFMDDSGNPLPNIATPSYDFSGRIYPDILFFKGSIVTTPSVMVRKEAVDKAGFFDERMDICEDLDLWRRITRHSVVEQIKENLVLVRMKQDTRLPLWDFLKARQFFYKKSFSEDLELNKRIRINLYSELYAKYAIAGLRQGMFVFFLFSQMKLFLLGPGIIMPFWSKLKAKYARAISKRD